MIHISWMLKYMQKNICGDKMQSRIFLCEFYKTTFSYCFLNQLKKHLWKEISIVNSWGLPSHSSLVISAICLQGMHVGMLVICWDQPTHADGIENFSDLQTKDYRKVSFIINLCWWCKRHWTIGTLICRQ